MMKLKLRWVHSYATNHKALVLCDDKGVPLPGQTKISFTNGVGEVSRVTVEFVVDGDNISIVD